MTDTIYRIRLALKGGREIEVIALGGDRAMIAFEHPYLANDCPAPMTNRPNSDLNKRNTKKVNCYWYTGEKRQSATFNLENLMTW